MNTTEVKESRWLIIPLILTAVSAILYAMFSIQMMAFESARLLIHGRMVHREIDHVESKRIIGPQSVETVYTAYFTADGISTSARGSIDLQAGDVVYILEDTKRAEFRIVGKINTTWRRLWVCSDSMFLLLPLCAMLGGTILQLYHLVRFTFEKWKARDSTTMWLLQFEHGLRVSVFFIFGSTVSIVWLGLCLRLSFVVLAAPRASYWQTGFPLTLLTLAPLVPFVHWLCRLRDSRHWETIESIVFVFLAGRLLYRFGFRLIEDPTITAQSTDEAIKEALLYLFGG